MFLSDKEIYELTKKQRRDAQVRALRFMGIEFRERADGSVAVLQEHINKVLGGIVEKKVRLKTAEPNWSGVC